MGAVFAWIYDPVMRRAEARCLREWRRAALATARGTVVELGAGTGASLAAYPATGPQRIVLTEPDAAMRRRLERKVAEHRAGRFEVVDAPADRLPFDDASVDVVFAALVLCTVPDPLAALREARRVLRPTGRLIVVEHVVAAPGSHAHRWQHRLDRVWQWCAEGCSLTRDTAATMERAGFEIVERIEDELRPAPAVVRRVLRAVAVPG